MATRRLTFEEAVEELRRHDDAVNFREPDPAGFVWAYNYDPNGEDGEWDLMTGFVSPNELIEDYGPFVLTGTENETIDVAVLTPKEQRFVLKNELLEQEAEEFIETCPADGQSYDRRDDLDHELHDSQHPNHLKACAFAGGHYHEGIVDGMFEGDNHAWLETVRFDPEQAISRLHSFIESFEGDSTIETVTLDQAMKALEASTGRKLLRQFVTWIHSESAVGVGRLAPVERWTEEGMEEAFDEFFHQS